mgnify:CR=1 FL=1
MERERNERARQMRGLFSVELKKGRITGSIVTPTHGGFRRPDLNTVAGSARRIFLRKEINKDGPKYSKSTPKEFLSKKRKPKPNP